MRSRRGEEFGIIKTIILVVIILVLVLIIINKFFYQFNQAVSCKGYCVASPADCTTNEIHDDDYCKKNSPNKPICCVDPSYKGDPAGEHSTTGTNPYLVLSGKDGAPVDQTKPITFVKDEAKELTLGYNHKDAGNCIVVARDNNFNPGKAISSITTFDCDKSNQIEFKFGPEYVGKDNLNLDMIVLKKGKDDASVLDNWLTSMKTPIRVTATAGAGGTGDSGGTPYSGTGTLRAKSDVVQERTVYYGNKLPAFNTVDYVDYDREKSTLICTASYDSQVSGTRSISMNKQSNCVFEIEYNTAAKQEQEDKFLVFVSTPDNVQRISIPAKFTVRYYNSPEEYCGSATGNAQACEDLGCTHTPIACVYVYSIQNYCSKIEYAIACDSSTRGGDFCSWDLTSDKCLPADEVSYDLVPSDMVFNGQIIYFGQEFTEFDLWNYVDYYDKTQLTCTYDMDVSKGISVQQNGCKFKVVYDKTVVSKKTVENLVFKIADDRQDITEIEFKAAWKVQYTPNEYCRTLSGSACTGAGCSWTPSGCVLGSMEEYCRFGFPTQQKCNNGEVGYCEWDPGEDAHCGVI